MNFHAIYRVSFYVMLFLATLTLSVDASELSRIAMLYPFAVAGVSVFAFFTVDKYPKLGLNNFTMNLLGIISPMLVYAEYQYDENLLLLALAHWFVYLQMIKILRDKSTRDEWFLTITSLLQVIIGTVISQSDVVGALLMLWALSALWVLGLFTLRREAKRGLPAAGTTVTPALDQAAPYPGLITSSFLLSTLKLVVITIIFGGLMFLGMPRRGQAGREIRGDVLGKHLTGFDDEVQLGQLGEILENDSVVMTIELTDQDGKSASIEGEPLWRGLSMAKYDRGRWRKQQIRPIAFTNDIPGRPDATQYIKQLIKLEPTDNPVLFGLRPIYRAESPVRRFTPEFNEIDGSLYRGDTRPVSFEYVVTSGKNRDDTIQPAERYPRDRMLEDLLTLDPELKLALRPIAEKFVGTMDRTNPVEVARQIEHQLRDSGEFHYSLMMDVVDDKLDPVVDFLVNRKQGHCEYFASALTLLLRSIDIPARLVNGFKGGDWNDLAGVVTVRQKHAHSWVEVLEPTPPSDRFIIRTPAWVTLDPTPGLARDESVARVGGMNFGTRQFTDFVRYVWVFYIVGFNAERQQKFLYDPIMYLYREARRGFQMIWAGLLSIHGWMFHFPSVSSFMTWRGFVSISLNIIGIIILIRLVMFIVRRVRRAMAGDLDGRSSKAIGVLIYRRLVTLLTELGLERPDWETPREFAKRATLMLVGNAAGPGHEAVADVPSLVVEAYYRIRFGHDELDETHLAHIESRLDALEARIHPNEH